MGNFKESFKELPIEDQPISEQFRLAALDWADKEAAADLLENMKTTTLERLKQQLINREGDMPDSHAERRVKATEAWSDLIHELCTARSAANKAKVLVDVLKMRFNEWQASDANQRAERRYSR